MKAAPIIIPDQPKLRVDESGNEYYVVFDKKQINSILESFNKNKQHQDLNLFINDPSHPNFDNNIPEGSLMGTMSIEHDGGFSFEFKINT